MEEFDGAYQQWRGPVPVVEQEDRAAGAGGAGEDRGEGRAHLLQGDVGRAVVEQSGGQDAEGGIVLGAVGGRRCLREDRAHRFGEGGERAVVAVVAAASGAVHGAAGAVGAAAPLPDQPGLAGARLARQVEQPGAAAGGLSLLVQAGEFGAASDEGDVEAAQQFGVVGAEGEEPVGGDAVGLALEGEGAGLLDGDGGAGGAQRLRADQDLPRAGVLLQPGGHVDRLAGDQRLPGGGVGTGHHLPGVDADPDTDAQAEALLQFGVEAFQRLADAEGGGERPAGVVLVDVRDAEDRHDGIADEFLRCPATRLDLRAHQPEPAQGDGAQRLRVEGAGERGGADHVAEEHGHRLALVLGQRQDGGGGRHGPFGAGGGGRPAGRAEPGVRGEPLVARGAGHLSGSFLAGRCRAGGVDAPVPAHGCGPGPTGVRTGRRPRSRRAPAPPGRRRRAVP